MNRPGLENVEKPEKEEGNEQKNGILPGRGRGKASKAEHGHPLSHESVDDYAPRILSAKQYFRAGSGETSHEKEQQEQAEKIRKEGREKLKPLFEEMKDIREKMDKLREDNMLEFEKILTPEQKEKLKDIKARHHEEMKKRHEARKARHDMRRDRHEKKLHDVHDKD